MDWKERQTTKKKDDTVEKARLAREARAQQRQQVKPALAIGRAARGFLARRRVAHLCGERVDKKLGDILKLKAFLATAGKKFVAPAETAAPLLREVAFAEPDAARFARVCEAVLVPGLSEAPAGDARLDLGADASPAHRWRLERVARQLWAAGLEGRAPALVDAVGLLVTRAAFLAHRLVDLWVDDGGPLRRAVDAGYDKAAKLEPRESGDRAVDASVASAVAIAAGGAADAGRGGLFAARLWAAPLLCDVAGPKGREALATNGTRDALAELATHPPAGGSERSGVDAAAWLLGALGALGRRLLVEDASLARPFALAVAAALAATDNAAAVLCDEDAVICWKVVNGAKQPVVACARLRWHASRCYEAREGVIAPLADALIAKRDCAFLDASSAADDALDADLAGLSADALSEAAAKKKRSLLADVVGSRWARKLEATAGSVESSFAKAFGLSSSKKSSPLADVTAASRAAAARDSAKAAAPPAYSDDDERDLEAFGRFFCLGLAAACPRLRVAALTALAFHDDGPRRLWGYLQARHARALAPSLERYFGAASAPTHPPRDVVVALTCVALLRHALLIVDDDELQDRSRPVAPFQLRRVAEALKRGLFAHCWREGGPDRRRDAYGSWCATLLHDLHSRSCRRPFARPALWLVAEADEGAAREELRKGATRRSRLLLASMPFALPFRARVRLFQEKVCPDGQSNARAEEIRFFDASSPRPTDKTVVRVRRSHVLADGLDRIAGLSPAALKGRLSVAFVDDWGRAEAGIDAGGLFKEFWTELSGAAFSMDFGLFKTTAHDGLLFPNPDSAFVHGERDHLRLFHFLGRVLGKALREGITIQPRFTRSFLSFVRGDFNYVTLLEDLKSLDPDLHRNLKFLQLYDGDVADLGLDFSVSFDRFGECVTANLIPNGADVEVTRANRHAYVQAVAKFHMVDRLDAQSRAFVAGLGDVVDLALLRRFSEPELQLLISGAEDAVDVDDLKAHARYEGYLPGDKHVKRFWAALRSLRPADRAALLKFVTACERAPPLGFAALAPPFTIRKVPILRDADKLPTASTCFNVLKLPTYSSEAVLRARLLTSVHSGAGFDLS